MKVRETVLIGCMTALLGVSALPAQALRGEDEPARYSYSQAATFHNDLSVEQQEFYDELSDGYQEMYMKLNCEGRNRAMCINRGCPDDAVLKIWNEGIYYNGCMNP
jgi:hypothetical protein